MNETKIIKFDVRVEKSQEKSYIKIPLEIPDNVERVDISYDYKGAYKSSRPIGEKNVIDLAVLDTEGNDIGATGSDYKSVWFGVANSSPGYKTLDIKAGTWYIILGAYMIENGGTVISYKITLHFKKERWLRGDPHTHTVNSDGVYDYYGLARLAKKKGMDFVIITDHNNTIDGGTPKISGLTIIDGVELTNYKGHFNYWGVSKPYSKTYAANNYEEFLQLNDQAVKKGAIRIINHPTSACPWLWGTDFDYNGIEVFNGPLVRDNLKAISYWEEELKKGKRVFAVGGSDFHKFSILFGLPSIAVFAKSPSKVDILDAIKEGKVAIVASAKAPILVIKCSDVTACGAVKLTSDTKVSLECEKLKRGQEIVVLNQNGVIFCQKAKTSKPLSLTLDVKEKGYIRAEIRKKPSLIIRLLDYFANKALYAGKKPTPLKYTISSMTNPIYFD